MMNIVVVDSGLGGLNVLNECKKLLPNVNFVYIADKQNAPYGNKSKRKLLKIAFNLVDYIISKYNPKIIVIACNTMTAVTIKFLREKYKNINFVGTEPAIKPALKKYNKKEILLFATKNTNKYYKNIRKIQIKNLPKIIDENINNLNIINPTLKKHFCKNKYKNIKAIVLGCTHYIYLKENLKLIFGEKIEFFDNTYGVANRVKYIYETIKFDC